MEALDLDEGADVASCRTMKRLGQSALFSLAVFATTISAQAELVSYDFTASIQTADTGELAGTGLPAAGDITGSFVYDTESGHWGGSGMSSDPSLALNIDGSALGNVTSLQMWINYQAGQFTLQETADNGAWSAAVLTLSGQSIEGASTGALPTSLSLGGGATGLLQIFVGGFGDVDLSARLTSLTRSGASTLAAAAPELDPASGGAALVLLLGGAAMMAGRRRRNASTTAFC